jgi:hypothetical protein
LTRRSVMPVQGLLTDESNVLAMHPDRFKTTKPATNRTTNNIL